MKRKNKSLNGFYESNKKLVWVGGAVVLVGGAYLIFRLTKKGGAANVGKQNIASMNPSVAPAPTVVYVNAPATGASATGIKGFPIRKGSEKALVKEMQQYLIDIAGTKRILPTYGADGDFGNETVTALKTYFGVTEISEAQLETLKNAAPMWWDSANTSGMFKNLREILIKKTFPNFNKAALLNIDKQAR